MRISDWSSDVCSPDLAARRPVAAHPCRNRAATARLKSRTASFERGARCKARTAASRRIAPTNPQLDRKSVGEGKSVSVRVDLGGRRIIQKKKTRQTGIRRKHIKNKQKHINTQR